MVILVASKVYKYFWSLSSDPFLKFSLKFCNR